MTTLPQPICGHALQDPSTDSRKAKKWRPGNTGTRTRNTGRQRSEPGERDGQPGGPTGNEKATRRDGLERLEAGGAGPGSQAPESGPIPDGARSSPVSGDGRRRLPPPVAACPAGVDILQGAPVNVPATGLPNRRKPLSGNRLRPEFACGRWCVNTQAWVVIQTV